MALTPAEKQKRYRDRQRAKKEVELKRPESIDGKSLYKQPFYEWLEDDDSWSCAVMNFDIAGIEPPLFHDDSDPQSFEGEIEKSDGPLAPGGGSLARAEILVGQLIDAAGEIAESINNYKRHELKMRISELEQRDLSDPAIRKQALADIVRLQKMRDQLSKRVRFTFQQWKATGE